MATDIHKHKRDELVRQIKTTTRYAIRQGMTAEDVLSIVHTVKREDELARRTANLPDLELRDKGINNDMRNRF